MDLIGLPESSLRKFIQQLDGAVRLLELCTGSRLHFGLMELAAGQPYRFGGLGLMIASPQVRVRITQARVARVGSMQKPGGHQHCEDSEVGQRVRSALEQAERELGRTLLAGWAVDALDRPLLHSGLGLGTQLAAAVVAAFELATRCESDNLVARRGPPIRDESPVWQVVALAKSGHDTEQIRRLAMLSGRGKRSAIGLHGFLYGGLVQDLGYDVPAARNELDGAQRKNGGFEPRFIATRSISFPDSWPVVLILGTQGSDVQGASEERLITAAAAAPNGARSTMLSLSEACLIAAAECDFIGFVEAIEGYMKIAANLFASVQAGRYRDAQIAQRVELAVEAGLRGVGQSSWGPTVFGFASDADHALRAADQLRRQFDQQAVEVIITSAANHGARWRSAVPGVQYAG